MLGAVAQGLAAGAKGFAPAARNVLDQRQREGEQQRTSAAQQIRHQQTLDQRDREFSANQDYREATLAANEAKAKRDHGYRMALEATRQARAEVDMARVRANANNRNLDPRAEKAASALTDHLENRPVMDMDTDPQLFQEELARWQEQTDEIARLWGYSSAEDVGVALGGEPSRHPADQSGLRQGIRFSGPPSY